MEDTILHEKAAESEVKPSYSILVFNASKLPSKYLPLIYSRWLRSLRFGNNLFRRITSHQYYKHYHYYIEKLMSKPDCLVRLAVLSDDHDVVLGFSVSREDVLDYIHVHSDYRMNRIGTSLVPEGITTFTHFTTIAIDIWNRDPKYNKWNFNPFA